MKRRLAALTLLFFCISTASAGTQWPGFRGPNHDGAIRDTPLFQGEALSLSVGWKVDLGSGYSATAVGDGRVYAMFAEGDADLLGGFDTESGKRLWSYRISDTYSGHDGSHDGPISTPTFSGGRVYGLGAWGHLFAVDAQTGREIWAKHLKDDIGADKPWYGFTSSPIAVDGVLVVTVSQTPPDENADAASEESEEGEEEKKPRIPMAVVGVDLETGETRWILGDDAIEYHSPIVATLGGRRQILAAGKDTLYGIDATSGTILWSHAHAGDERAMGGMTIIPLPAGDGRIFLMNKVDSSVMLKIGRTGTDWTIDELWSGGAIVRSYVPPVYKDGYIYGMNNRIFTCMDAATGDIAWRSREPGDGFPTLIGDHLVVMTKSGSLHVIDASPDAYREAARIDLFDTNSWSEVAFADGHLYARSMSHLARVELNAASSGGDDTGARFGATVLGRFLAGLDDASDKAASIDEFLAAHPTSPIVEDDGTVHFVYRGPAEDVGIVGDMIGFRREDPMTRVPGTDLFHYTTRLEPTAAVTYGFIVDYAEPVADPRQPRTASGLFGDVSWFSMPAWEAPDFLDEASRAQRGRLETVEWTSAVLEDAVRSAQVYLPAGYDASDIRYPVAYVNFGKEALEQGRMKQALDNLIGSRVAPLIAVFIHADPEDARRDVRNPKYGEMIVTELVPTIDERFRTIADTRGRAAVGFGRSAGSAMMMAFTNPETFGRLGVQSAFMGAGDLPELAERGADERPMVMYMDWGTYHMRSPHEAWSLADANRELWVALREAGYRPAGGERTDGYGWPIWSARTDELLAALFPLR